MHNKQSNSSHWNGLEYSKNSEIQYVESMDLLNKNTFRDNENILDVGCGDGKITREIAKKVPAGYVLGIDASISMLDIAKQGANPSQLNFQHGNVNEMTFTNQFDTVTSFFCLQWVQDKADAIKRIYHALKPQGRFMMIIPFQQTDISSVRRELMESSYFASYFKNYAHQNYGVDTLYEKYAKEAGFTISFYQVINKLFSFPNVTAFTGFLTAITPQLSYLPEQEKIKFMNETAARLVDIYPVLADGSFVMPFTTATLLAKKS